MTDTTTNAHEAVTRGLERALRDLGVDLVGCPPSVLSGHVIKALREDGWLRVRNETLADEPQWHVAVEIPMRLREEVRDSLLSMVTDAANDWAEQTRDTGDDWEPDVYGCVEDASPPNYNLAVLVALDDKEDEMREWWDKNHSHHEGDAGLAWLEAIAWFRTLRTAREAS